MVETGPVVQVTRVAELEERLEVARQETAKTLRRLREDHELSLRDVAPKVKLTPTSLLKIERGESWRTKTVERLARYYESLSAA